MASLTDFLRDIILPDQYYSYYHHLLIHPHNCYYVVAFVVTIVAVLAAIIMFSCFGKKKKGDKKKRGSKEEKKNNAPTAQTPGVTVEIKKSRSASPDIIKKEANAFQDANDALGDFSAVRETEILKSELRDDQLYEFNKDSSIKPSQEESVATRRSVKRKEEAEDANDTTDGNAAIKKGSPPLGGRSSMLDDINSALASFQSGAKTAASEASQAAKDKTEKLGEDTASKIETTVVTTGKETAAKIETTAVTTGKDIATKIETSITTHVEKKVETVKKQVESRINETEDEIQKKTDSLDSLPDLKVTEDVKDVPAAAEKISVTVSKESEKVSAKIESVMETKVNDVKDKGEELSKETAEKLEEKCIEVKDNVSSHLQTAVDQTSEKSDHVDIGEIICEVKETAKSQVSESMSVLKSELGITSDEKEKTAEKPTVDAEVTVSKEAKIPPKVSPKPSPKLTIKHEANAHPLVLSQDSDHDELSSFERMEEKIFQAMESATTDEKQENTPREVTKPVKSPPGSPTTPTSPTSPNSAKTPSRIPMSKKASGIPKLSFGANKSTSASPVSSPDSAGLRRQQQKDQPNHHSEQQVLQADKNHENNSVDSANLKNDTDAEPPASPPPKSDNCNGESEELTRSSVEITSPSDDGKGSKRKLMKLRYSGRKKSSESKSDESGSDRGSRAGSEAKSDDDKARLQEENAAEAEKNSRIPVRGASKPRSSPPKTVEH